MNETEKLFQERYSSFFRRKYGLFVSAFLKIAAVFILSWLYVKDGEYTFYLVSFIAAAETVTIVLQYLAFRKERRSVRNFLRSQHRDDDEWENQRKKEDFFALWAHQIKTPIAALQLLLQSENQDVTACKGEVFKIERYVEMALGFLRFEEMGSDMELLKYDLEPMVKQTVRKFAPLFISKHLSVKLENLGFKILTDEKWFCFVLEQLLSNAVKYTVRGGIEISAKQESGKLLITMEDTGIGIRSEDLPRLFEKGFTGYNGRMDKKASGLGLYLCKSICDRLGHGISVESEENKGTKVTVKVFSEEVSDTDLQSS